MGALRDLENHNSKEVKEKLILALNALGAYEGIKKIFSSRYFNHSNEDKEIIFDGYLKYFIQKE